MSLSLKQIKFTRKVGAFLVAINEMGYEVTLGHVWRDTETQKRLFDAGLSWTMKSKHLDRLAIDLNLFINGIWVRDDGEAYRPLGELWESMGGKWGGRIGVDEKDYDKKVGKDPGHFEDDV